MRWRIGCEVEACGGFVFAAWADDRGVQFADLSANSRPA
jgi:hypothetical protein